MLYDKILFGLESAELTQTSPNAINVLHLKRLRKIFKMTTTFVDRANTNQNAYDQASELFKSEQGDMAKIQDIQPLSAIYLKRKQQYFSKVAISDAGDPVKNITFQRGTLLPHSNTTPNGWVDQKYKWATTKLHRIWEETQR